MRFLRALLLLAALPSAVWAHGGLKSSSPARDARLVAPPRALVLTFTEHSPLAVTRIRLLSANGAAVELGPMEHLDGDSLRVVRAAISERLAAGSYTVEWQTAGEDGHPVRGSFGFVVLEAAQPAAVSPAPLAPAAAVPVAAAPESLPTTARFDAESWAYVLIRFLTFAGIVVLVGTVSFQQLIVPRVAIYADPDVPLGGLGAATDRAASVGRAAALLLGAAAFARLGAQSYAILGADALDLRNVASLLLDTKWGLSWFVQIAGVLVVLYGARRVRGGAARGDAMVALGTLMLAAVPALSGHAASASSVRSLAIAADTLHVIGAGGWIGSLTVVLLIGLPAMWTLPAGVRERGVAALFRTFSPLALGFAGLLGLTGLFAAWIHLGSVGAIIESRYGLVLAVKLSLLSVVGATGFYNWRRVLPVLDQPAGTSRLRKSAGVELAVAVLVLIVTAVLVATPTPMD